MLRLYFLEYIFTGAGENIQNLCVPLVGIKNFLNLRSFAFSNFAFTKFAYFQASNAI